MILWSAREPNRIGERARCPEGQRLILGRAPTVSGDEAALCFAERRPLVRPDGQAPTDESLNPELLGEALSRRQLEIRAEGGTLHVRNLGRCPLWVNGALTGRAHVKPGDTIHLQQQLLLLCVKRHSTPAALRHYPAARAGQFGQPDADGMVGESHAMWQLREQIAACAGGSGHVLILGASGAGKELVAHAVHGMSSRAGRALVSENIAVMPASLGAALLFGNRRNFPNPGMEERTGLLGMAEGSTLFLDEIGDMTAELQPMFLRVMERSGEYTRLGDESHQRRANVRFIGATNHPERLRLELRRRFQHEVVVPDLQQRIEDVPLLVRHIMLSQSSHRGEVARFCPAGQVQIDPRFIEQLIRHRYSTHVSELGFLLERSIEESAGDVLLPLAGDPPARQAEPQPQPPAPVPAPGPVQVASSRERQLPSPDEAQSALDSVGGSVVRAAAKLSITRHQLNRLIRRNGLYQQRPDRPAAEGAGKKSPA